MTSRFIKVSFVYSAAERYFKKKFLNFLLPVLERCEELSRKQDIKPLGQVLQKGKLFVFWRNSHQWARASSFTRFPVHTNDAPYSVGILWKSDQLVAETFTCKHTTLTTERQTCPPVGFESTISAGERPRKANSRYLTLCRRGWCMA